ncbi:MAG: hypothetical protein LAT75_04600 [Candidatus Cyclonatronum sp.]|uniref:hypothetical protein n=1 Tax=Cyclonatronum sp. TaxID=3024185 RepID=UPI0025C1C7EC|nr:hypothetical protein [Cyclonatronum sp.]MCH8486121.1 hypothetical protein [Cyclonatronum sp.]
MTSSHELSIGIDGGGSGSRFVFYYNDQPYSAVGPILQARIKPADETAGLIAQIIGHICEKKNYPMPSRITAGIAGAAQAEIRQALTQSLKGIFRAAKITVMSDIAATFVTNFPDSKIEGRAVLICGTGSVLVYGHDGILKVAGGFGPALNEYGSGRQLGKDFMSCLMSCMDKGTRDPEVKAILEKDGLYLNTRLDALKLLYSSDFNPSTLAPTCLQLASTGHSSCRKIAEHHIESLLSLFAAAFSVKRSLKQVALHGGLFNSSWFMERVIQELTAAYTDIQIKRSYQDTAGFLAKKEISNIPVVCL